MNKDKSGALRYLLIPELEDTTILRAVFDQDEINDLIFERNKRHFSQAEGTPFTVSPLRELFGRKADTPDTSDLLAGHLPDGDILDQTTEAAREILKYLCDQDYPKVDTHITASDIKSGYKAWNEYTSTSPSGLHLGHAKTLVKCPKPPNADRKPSIADRLFSMEATKANIALEHGFVYSRWKKVVSAMLEKIPNMPRIDKLRIIHLFEADLNLLL